MHHHPEFNTTDDRYPSALCSRCHKMLYDIESGTKSSECHPPVTDIFSVIKIPITRSSELCCCKLCQTARFSPVGISNIPQKLQSHPIKRPLSKLDPLPSPDTVTICQRCHSAVGSGLPHNCTISQRRENLSAEIRVDPRGSEIHASDVLKGKMQTAHDSGDVTLATKGSDLKLSRPGSSGSQHGIFPNTSIPVDEMRRLQDTAGLSLEQTKVTAQFLRERKGRQCIACNLMPELRTRDHMLSDV
jgi:hypothetical protein